MAHNSSDMLSGMASDYLNVRTVPATLSVLFIIAGLYQFGGISQVTFPWINYTIQQSHAVLISLGALVIAFMSSDTRDFQRYEMWEQVIIGAGPIVILGYEYVQFVTDFINGLGDPLGMQLAFLVTVLAWFVAIQ